MPDGGHRLLEIGLAGEEPADQPLDPLQYEARLTLDPYLHQSGGAGERRMGSHQRGAQPQPHPPLAIGQRRAAELLLEGAAETHLGTKAVAERQIQHPLAAREQRLRRQAQFELAHIVGHRLPCFVQEDPLQLPARPAALLGQLLQRQRLIQMPVDVVEHPLDAGEMGASLWRGARGCEGEGRCHWVVGIAAGRGARCPSGHIKHGRRPGGKWPAATGRQRTPFVTRRHAVTWAFNKAVTPAWQAVTKMTHFPVRLFENKYIN